MSNRHYSKILFLILLFFWACSYGKSPWHGKFGLSAGTLTPIMFSLGVGYESVLFYVDGFGFKDSDKSDEYWVGLRGNLSWTLFKNLPFNVDLGVSGGYQYAEAPNNIHKDLNKANNKTLVLPYNYRESLDISLEYRIHLYGIYSQITYPIYKFKDHESRNFQWRLGYMVNFIN